MFSFKRTLSRVKDKACVTKFLKDLKYVLIVLGFVFRVNKYIVKVGCIEDIKVFIKCFINKSLKYTRYII